MHRDDQPRNKLEAPRRQEFKDCGLCRGWEGFRGLLVWIGLLELPLGSLMARLNNRGRTAPSSFAKVYESVRNLDSSYFATSNTKHSLLKPNLPSSNVNHTPLLQELAYKKLASYCSYHVNTPKKDMDGHVKGSVTYMVMDDLSLKPLSSISSITLLNTYKIKDVSCLEEKIVNVDIEKGLELVKAAFESNTVLTDVFLGVLPSCKKTRRS